MAKKKRNPKAQRRDRIRYLKRKASEGKATEDEVRELERYEAERADPPDDVQANDSPDDSPETDDGGSPAPDSAVEDHPADPSGVQAGPGATADTPVQEAPGDPPPVDAPGPAAAPPPPPPPRAKAPPPPRPPRTDPRDHDPPRGKASADWQDKYKADMGGAGREQTCTALATQWVGLLQGMASEIKSVGVEPMVDPNSPILKAAIVLTLDAYLPARVQLKPEHMAAFGTTLILGQRFYHRKEIAAKHKTDADRKAHADVMRKAQEERNQRESTPATPDPEPARVSSDHGSGVVSTEENAHAHSGANGSANGIGLRTGDLALAPGGVAFNPDDVI